jgi:hypothetical protein
MNVRFATKNSHVQTYLRNMCIFTQVNGHTSARYAKRLLYLQMLSGCTFVFTKMKEHLNAKCVVKVIDFNITLRNILLLT